MNTIVSRLMIRSVISILIVIVLFVIAIFGGFILKALEWGPAPIFVLSPHYAVVRSTLCIIDPNDFNPEIVVITRILNSLIKENVNAFYVQDN